MTRSLCVAVLFSTVAVFGCDNAADEQNKAIAAQAEANVKIAAVGKEADAAMKAAQAEADKKIGEAQASFAKLREDYRHSTTTNLADLDKKIADLTAKAKAANGKAKADLDASLKVIASSRDAFVTDYKTIEAASATTWDATKARLEKAREDLKALIEKA